MPRSTVAGTCARCGSVFQRFTYQAKEYCGRQCSGAARRQPVAPRLWARVAKSAGCWLWQGSSNSNGYGMIGLDGRNVLCHRVSWELAHGTIPDDIDVLHRCDTPRCVRPDHLVLGDHAANMRDMADKRRAPSGNRNPRAKLTPESVAEIRHSSAPNVVLAANYGVHPSTISLIRSGKNWAHF